MTKKPNVRSRTSGRLLRWLLISLFWGALAFALVMALLPEPPAVPSDPSDKQLHMLAFATLTMLWLLAYPGTPLIVILIVLGALGGLIELVQGTKLINREASLADWFADIVAILAILVCVAFGRAVCSLLRR